MSSTKGSKDPKSSTGKSYQDYFNSKFHARRLEAAFKRTHDKIIKIGLEVGVMEAISEAQGVAAAVAHFYEKTGMKANGSTYFRSLADTIEGKAPLSEPDKTDE